MQASSIMTVHFSSVLLLHWKLSASQERKGAEVRKLVAEASQSHGLGAATALSRGGGGEGTELGGSHANGSTSSRTRDNKNMASQTTGSVNGSRGRVGGGTQSEKAGCTSDLNLILFDEVRPFCFNYKLQLHGFN